MIKAAGGPGGLSLCRVPSIALEEEPRGVLAPANLSLAPDKRIPAYQKLIARVNFSARSVALSLDAESTAASSSSQPRHFDCKNLVDVLEKDVPAAKKSTSKASETRKLGQVEVLFAAAPRDFLHFNRYLIELKGDFFAICFWYEEEMDVYPVFRGMILKQDLAAQIPPLKRYIEKIGIGAPSKPGRGVRWDCAPVAFNIIDCVSREAAWGEIVIRKFSHKSVTEAASGNGHVTGITHGAYISSGLLHRAFVMELIKLASVSQ